MAAQEPDESQLVRLALPDRLREKAKSFGVGALVIPTFCRLCCSPLFVWLGVRISQICQECIEDGRKAKNHVFVMRAAEGDCSTWDKRCMYCGKPRNWRQEDQGLCPGAIERSL